MDLQHPINCLTFNFQRAARSLARGFEEAARVTGLTSPQFATLALLGARGPLSVGELADSTGSDRTTLTRNLDLMSNKGWIEFEPAKDRRFRIWKLTAEGKAVVDQAMPAWIAWQSKVVNRLGDATARQMLDVMKAL